jgi:hypothetical protein
VADREQDPRTVTVTGKAHGDFSTIATDEETEND